MPDLELLPPTFEYSVYYPAFLDGGREPWITPSHTYAQLSDTQYINEMRNMVAHGLTNPNFYEGAAVVNPDGSLDFTQGEEYISLREQAGMPRGVTLYLFDGAGMRMGEGELTEQQKQRNMEGTKLTMAWAKKRGCGMWR